MKIKTISKLIVLINEILIPVTRSLSSKN